MAIYELSGSLDGQSDLSASLAVVHFLEDTALGTSSLTGTLIQVGLLSGLFQGSSSFTYNPFVSLSGTMQGTSSLSGTPVYVSLLKGYFFGQSSLYENLPLACFGTSQLQGVLTLNTVVPFCPPAIKEFSWGHVFGRNDLVLYVTDRNGNPFSPMRVTYTLLQTVRGRVEPIVVGPQDRKPVMSSIGEYYVVADVLGGQPGDWFVRWRYQRTPFDSIYEETMPFRLLDGANNPLDRLTRTKTYGWIG